MSKDKSTDPYDRIYDTVRRIPVGYVASYGQIAELAGLPRRARLVGRALRVASPQQRLPWHRVLRADGTLAFAKNSDAFKLQRQRLLDEGVAVVGSRVRLSRFRWNPLDEMLWNPDF